MVDDFEKINPVWQDFKALTYARLAFNYEDSMDHTLSAEQLRLLQGSTKELRAILQYPDAIREAIKNEKEKEDHEHEILLKKNAKS